MSADIGAFEVTTEPEVGRLGSLHLHRHFLFLAQPAIISLESHPHTSKATSTIGVECGKCDSCGFTEDFTLAYISRVRER